MAARDGPVVGTGANEEVAEALRRQARLIDLAPVAFIVRQLDGTITFWSAGAERLYGWRREEALGRCTHELLRTEFPEELEGIVARLRHGESWSGVLRHYTRDGRRVTVQSYWLAELDANGQVVELLESNTDITEYEKASEAVRQSEARFRALAENIPQLAWMTDGDGWIFWYNRRWFDYTGTTLEQMQGWGWQAVHHPEHVERVTEKFKRALETGEPWEDTFPLRSKDGGYRWFLSRAFPIRDNGKISRWFGTNTDITEVREAHEALAQAQGELREHAQRLEEMVAERTAELRATVDELEAFSYTLSHDMRAPLRAIQSFSGLALEETKGKVDAGTTEMLGKVVNSANRMDRLIQDVLALSRVGRQDIRLGVVDLEGLVREVIEERPALEEPRARVEVASRLLPVLGHEPSLRQCLTNLLSNAVKFVAPGVKPHVRVYTEARDDKVRLWVEDNGIGIPREAQGKIFGIFQRLHRTEEYEGTGIGLAIVRKAVERLGGEAGVESEVGRGSRFWAELKAV